MIELPQKLHRFFLFGMYLILTVPLWVSARFYFPFITVKVVGFELALLFLLVIGVSHLWSRKEPIRLSVSMLHLVILGYLLIVIISSLFGIDPSRSFWGTMERGWGGLMLLDLVIFFFLASAVLRKEDWEKLFRFSVFISVIASFVGILQWQGIAVFNYSVSGRVVGPIGNASLFATYLLLHLFLTWWLAEKTSSSTWRAFYTGVFVFQFLVLFLTETRGAIIAFFVGVGVWLLVKIFASENTRIRRFAFLGILGLGVIAIGFWSLRKAPFVAEIPVLDRLATISPVRDVSTQYRVLSWGAAWQGFKERPILGWGYENYNRVFDKYFPPRVFYDEGSQVWSDRAHNLFVDAAVMSGGLGLVLLVSIFVSSFWTARNSILAALVVAYGVQSLFVFEALPSTIIFFAVLGFLARQLPGPEGGRAISVSPVVLRGFGSMMLLGLLLLHWFGGFKPALASRELSSIIRQAKGGISAEELTQGFGTVLEASGEERYELRQAVAEFFLGLPEAERRGGFPPETLRRLVESLGAGLEESIRSRPEDVRQYVLFMKVLNGYPRLLRDSSSRVETLGREALTLSPTRMEIYWEIGNAFLNEDRPGEAIPYFEKAVALYPFPGVSHWNLFLAYLMAGDEAGAAREEEYLRNFGFRNDRGDALLAIGARYLNRENFEKARAFLEAAYRFDPETRGAAEHLKVVYEKLGEQKKLEQLLTGTLVF